ncbi:hypothetical protein ACQ4PT_020610 [Festuca glaucescens]
MAETLLLPVVRAAAGKAADALVQRVTSMCGVDDDRHKLERQLLADAEMKSETNQYIKRWMKDFRTLAYEANDVLDDFQYEAQIGKSKIRKDSPSTPLDKPILPSPLLSPVRLASEISLRAGQGEESGKRSSRLAAKPTAGLSTMEKVKVVLLKKNGVPLADATPHEPGLEKYTKIYTKPLHHNFIDAVTSLVEAGSKAKAAAGLRLLAV